jgi:hypothetical protein
MKIFQRFRILILLAALLLPPLVRGFSHYYWFPTIPKVASPDFSSFQLPQPPISTPAAETISRVQNKLVVIDYQHGNQFSPNEIDSLVGALTERGAAVEISNSGTTMDTRLKYASAFVVFSPLVPFQDNEVNAVRQFVAAGGRLTVFTDPTRGALTYDYFSSLPSNQPDVDNVNPLLAPFGITVRNDYLYNLVENEGNFRNVLLGQFSRHPLTDGLDQVAFYGAHSLVVQPGTVLIQGDRNTYSSLTDAAGPGQGAAVLSADGNVLALGDFSFLLPPYDTVADNRVLISRLAEFLLSGERTHRLADFPYLFERTISVVMTGGLQLNSDLLGPLGSLQTALAPLNLSLVTGSDAWDEGDLLVLGTLNPSEDLDLFITPFELNLENPDSATLPGFGTIGRSGIGLLLYRHTSARNTLVLLADLPEDLPALINLLASGYLGACLTQDEAGVCSLGPAGNYFGLDEGFFPTDYFGDYPYPGGTPTPYVP